MQLQALITAASQAGELKMSDVNGSFAQWATASISGITSDSRQVIAGSLFVALTGEHVDGHQFVDTALKQGAAVILVATSQADRFRLIAPAQTIVLSCDNTSLSLALLSAAFHHYPGKALRLIGVTGTNGKTTVTHLIEQMLLRARRRVGLIGTLGTKTPGQDAYHDTGHTTPMAPQLQAMLADMQHAGVEDVVMEVSSHALSQHRVTGCDYQVAVMTNLTQDHLDFHKTMERYANAKAVLFQQLNPANGPRTAVINLDDAWAETFINACPDGVTRLTYGITNPGANVRAENLTFNVLGASFDLITPHGNAPVVMKLAGAFSVYNALAAIGAGLSLGLSLQECVASVEATAGVRGRFEVVSEHPYVIVDYAHTPDGLENVLTAARQVTPAHARLVAVFGCGGDRDATKRPKMGRIVERLADRLIVTSDNPRSEDPQQIITDILSGIEWFDPSRMQVNADREQAIHNAIDWVGSPDDVIVIAGKGHEDYQILADKTIHFDDREVVQAYIAQKRQPQPYPTA